MAWLCNKPWTWLAPVFLLFAVLPAPAGERGGDGFYHPLKTDIPPVIDGVLDDPVWREAPSVTGFKTFVPDFGRDMTEETVVYLAYDRRNLYFAFRCFDSRPEKIKAVVTSRDNIRPDDWVCVNLDSFNDQQSLYALYVNPLGIQQDSRFAGGQEDYSVDVVYASAGRLDDRGYCVEIAVPFESIRFAGRERVEMAVFFERRISRLSEQGSYPALKPERGYAFLTQLMPLLYEDIERRTLVEVLPAFTHRRAYGLALGSLERLPDESGLSLTGKVGLASDLVLDACWNPDFSQVEADAGQVDVNLRYDLFYPEKRPFFMEGTEHFLAGAAAPGYPLQSVVHTRNIIDPRFGFKLAGRVGPRGTVAAVLAQDELPPGSEAAARPLFSVVRYKRSLSQDGFLGAFWTGREQGGEFNRLAGLDGQVRLSQAGILGFHGFASWTKRDGSASASPGSALGFDYAYDTRNLNVTLSLHSVSADFETDAGFLVRNGLDRAAAAVTPKLYPRGAVLRRVTPQLAVLILRDRPSGLWEGSAGLSAGGLIFGATRITLGGAASSEIFLGRRFDTSGWSLQGTSQVSKQLFLQLVLGGARAVRYLAEPYQGFGRRARASLTFQPSEKINFEASWVYSDFFRSAGSGKEFDYTILRGKLSYQFNKYFFVRAVMEGNTYRRELLTDFLASFTHIPGTVIHLGYGSLYERRSWAEGEFRGADRYLETRRGLFFKASYLWRW
jgi:hypothetical protein